MEVYAEFKPCYLTRYLTECGFGKSPIIYCSEAHFVDGKSNMINGTLFITKDLKYVYCFYNGITSYYRVTNISSKPIPYKVNKIEEWYSITKEINKLKEQRRRLIQ